MPRRVLLLHAHPYPDRSVAGRALLDAVRELPELEVRSLYEVYPDFSIDVDAEQAALARADLVVWQAPFFWYGVPSLLSLWFEKVLAHGWAFGEGGTALRGKTTLWTVTTGGSDKSYGPGGIHEHPFATFIPPIEQTARFCGMKWAAPFIVHGSHHQSEEALAILGRRYRARIEELARETR